MAGAIAILIRNSLHTPFRRIDPTSARVILVGMANKVLRTLCRQLVRGGHAVTREVGVEVRLGHGVDQIDDNGVIAAGERIASRTVIWTAGVAPLPAGKWLNADTDRAGRMRIQPDLTVPGHPDNRRDRRHRDAQSGQQTTGRRRTVAMQQGRYAGRLIQRCATGKPEPPPFRCIISLHRQGHHGRRRSRLCRLTTKVAAIGIG